MAMNIEIRVSGLAAFYKNAVGDTWNVVFICDLVHPLKFKNGASAATELHMDGKDRFISISASKTIVPASIEGINFNKILNMAHPKMHAPGKLKVQRSGLTDIITMIIPDATLGEYLDTDPINYYTINRDNGKFENKGKVTKTAKLTIQLDTGSKGFTMSVQDRNGTSELVRVPFVDGTTHLLEFDNDCGLGCKTENDFDLYYHWLKDPLGTRFWAGKITGALAEAEERKSLDNMSLSDIRQLLSSDNGNCDPVVVEPPPG
jgi:hypothetical protein